MFVCLMRYGFGRCWSDWATAASIRTKRPLDVLVVPPCSSVLLMRSFTSRVEDVGGRSRVEHAGRQNSAARESTGPEMTAEDYSSILTIMGFSKGKGYRG